MSEEEIEKEMNRLAKLGLLEKRVVNGRPEFKLTQLGEMYVETNILSNKGGEE